MMSTPFVVTLAAGKGSRLRGLSQRQPKCLTVLAGRTLLDWQREAFDQVDLRHRALVVRRGWPPMPVEAEHAISVSGAGGPMDSLFAAIPEPGSAGILVCYGDIVFHPGIVRALLGTSGDICVVADRNWHALWSLRFDSVLEDAERFRASGTSITEIGGRADEAAGIEAQFIGMMKLSPLGFRQLVRLHRIGDDSTALLSRAVTAGIPAIATFIDGRWCEVDTDRDIESYRMALGRAEPWSHDWRQG